MVGADIVKESISLSEPDHPSLIFQPVAEKHHPGETQPPETTESLPVRAAMSVLTR